MANLKSSKKDVRRTAARTARNQARMSRLRTAMRAVRSADSREHALTALRETSSLLDRAGKSGLLHRNAAARHKSRLARFVGSKFPAPKK